MASELVEMIGFSDEALWQGTTPTSTKAQQERLARLNDLADDRALMAREKTEQTELLFAYEQSVLRRAQAFAILSQRSHRIPIPRSLQRQ